MWKLLLPLAICFGLLIAYVDSRPTWDDTGITVGALIGSCCVLGALSPERPWLWALAVGLWLPAYEIATSRSFGSLVALAFAFAGAYAGMGLRRTTGWTKSAQSR